MFPGQYVRFLAVQQVAGSCQQLRECGRLCGSVGWSSDMVLLCDIVLGGTNELSEQYLEVLGVWRVCSKILVSCGRFLELRERVMEVAEGAGVCGYVYI